MLKTDVTNIEQVAAVLLKTMDDSAHVAHPSVCVQGGLLVLHSPSTHDGVMHRKPSKVLSHMSRLKQITL